MSGDLLDLAALSPALAVEIAIALEEHRLAREDAAREGRRNGRSVAPLPVGFLEVRDRFAQAARAIAANARQDTTEPLDWSALIHAVRVPVQGMTIRQVADSLGVSPRSVERLIERGELASIRIGDGNVRVLVDDLNSYLAAQKAKSRSVA